MQGKIFLSARVNSLLVRSERAYDRLQTGCIRGLSVKFVDTANKTRIVYHRLMKFCINKYQLSGTMKTQHDSLFLKID